MIAALLFTAGFLTVSLAYGFFDFFYITAMTALIIEFLLSFYED